MTDEEKTIFLAAREQIDRSAFNRFKKSNPDNPTIEKFHQLQPLNSEQLRKISIESLAAAQGRTIDGSEPFPSTLWRYGAENTHGGRPFLGTLRQFAEVLLAERTRYVAPKRQGWVIEPTTNPEGRRTNKKTLAVHALFLDCDGTGEWTYLLSTLIALDYAYVAYQSGGWTPTTPKWRVVLPLHEPFNTSSPEKQLAWKGIYNHCRVVLGSIGRLSNVGFDPATETPCCPWFLTEKRSPEDPPRLIAWRPGRTLDLNILASILPPAPVEQVESGDYTEIDTISIDDEKFEQIVDALAAATAHVPSGRRDIYLAMPAVMLNRGIVPDDVRKIVEEVSSRYPRSHPDKHADNLHNAETTIAHWEEEGADARITQIGTLQALAPEVAAALDEVLPPAATGIRDALSAQLGEVPTPLVAAPPIPSATTYLPPDPPAPPAAVKKRRVKLSPLGKKLSSVASRLKKHKIVDRQIEGLLMLCVLRGEALPVAPEGVDALVCKLTRALGYNLPDISWLEALELASPTLLAMDFTQSIDRVAAAERAFYEGRGKRNKVKNKIAKKKLDEQEKRAARSRKIAR